MGRIPGGILCVHLWRTGVQGRYGVVFCCIKGDFDKREVKLCVSTDTLGIGRAAYAING